MIEFTSEDAPILYIPATLNLECTTGDDFLDGLRRLVDGEMCGPPPTKEQHDLYEKTYNEHHYGLYMTNDELSSLVGKRIQKLFRWDYETRSYHKYGIPVEWIISTYRADMSQHINCAGCGKELPYGETFTSLELHTTMGIGYGVCNVCYAEEWKRRKRGESK